MQFQVYIVNLNGQNTKIQKSNSKRKKKLTCRITTKSWFTHPKSDQQGSDIQTQEKWTKSHKAENLQEWNSVSTLYCEIYRVSHIMKPFKAILALI